MTVKLNPPPLQIPPDFVSDKLKSAFFSGLVQTLYQMWTALYSIRFTATTKTTDATTTGLMRVPVPLGRTMMIEAKIVARRTGGTSGAEGDSAWYSLIGGLRNIGGTLSLVGTANLVGGENQASWNVGLQFAQDNAVVVVQGAANNEVTWEGTVYTYLVGA